MKKSPLTNQQVAFLLSDLQKFWMKYRDEMQNTEAWWDNAINEANCIYKKHGEKSAEMIAAFIGLLRDRVEGETNEEDEKDYTH